MANQVSRIVESQLAGLEMALLFCCFLFPYVCLFSAQQLESRMEEVQQELRVRSDDIRRLVEERERLQVTMRSIESQKALSDETRVQLQKTLAAYEHKLKQQDDDLASQTAHIEALESRWKSMPKPDEVRCAFALPCFLFVLLTVYVCVGRH